MLADYKRVPGPVNPMTRSTEIPHEHSAPQNKDEYAKTQDFATTDPEILSREDSGCSWHGDGFATPVLYTARFEPQASTRSRVETQDTAAPKYSKCCSEDNSSDEAFGSLYPPQTIVDRNSLLNGNPQHKYTCRPAQSSRNVSEMGNSLYSREILNDSSCNPPALSENPLEVEETELTTETSLHYDASQNSSSAIQRISKATLQSFPPQSPQSILPSSVPRLSSVSFTSSLDQQCQNCTGMASPVTSITNSKLKSQASAPQVCSKRRVLIIGAGCSGLAAIKSCLDEGLEPLCVERSSDIGGLWNYKDNDLTGNAGIYRSLVINTSKEMMMFSDFPPPASFPPFLTHEKVLEYFRLYVDHFGLLRYIRFGAEVKRVCRAEGYDSTGKWKVEYVWRKSCKGGSTDETTDRAHKNSSESDTGEVTEVTVREVFDGVMICTGHHSVPHVPEIPGLKDFRGQVLHSRFYKESTPFLGKRVAILGMGNSAVDIACDLAKSANRVYLCSRRGAWIVPRTSFWGLPADMLANSRVVFTLPYRLLDWFVQVQANFRVDHEAYGLKPQHGVLNCHPTINDELPVHLVSGRVQTKPSITQVRRDGVMLDGGEFLPCDILILATGYDYRVDFVDPEDLKVEDNQSRLYKFMIPPHLPHPTLSVIGLIQAIGAVMPISEMQTRWAARLITGATRLPSLSEMQKDYDNRLSAMKQLYVPSRRHSMQTFWIDYMDQIASKVGAKPDLWRLLFKDPELALKCYLGPCLPAQYRLVGPNPWPGARDFIVGVFSRASSSKHGSRSGSQPQLRERDCHTLDSAAIQTSDTNRHNFQSKHEPFPKGSNLSQDSFVTPEDPQESYGVSASAARDEKGNFLKVPAVPPAEKEIRSALLAQVNFNETLPSLPGSKENYVQKGPLDQWPAESAVASQISASKDDSHSACHCNHSINTVKTHGNSKIDSNVLFDKEDKPTKQSSSTFYIWAILLCCIAWGVSHLLDRVTESLIG